MVELKDHHQQDMEDKLKFHSHPILMAQALVPCWKQMHVPSLKLCNLKGHM